MQIKSLGTRFRPLQTKPLFPVAGQPLIEHHIEQLCEVDYINNFFPFSFLAQKLSRNLYFGILSV